MQAFKYLKIIITMVALFSFTSMHVNSAEEAKRVVDAGKFAPIGNRGLSTSRQGYGVDNYHKKANDESLLMVLIEDIIAVQNLDEILEVDEIDVFFVGPGRFRAAGPHVRSRLCVCVSPPL